MFTLFNKTKIHEILLQYSLCERLPWPSYGNYLSKRYIFKSFLDSGHNLRYRIKVPKLGAVFLNYRNPLNKNVAPKAKKSLVAPHHRLQQNN